MVSLTANETAFAALKRDGSVVSWGNAAGGGDSSAVSEQLQDDVLTLAASDHAFTALKNDGSVVSWGDAESGGVTPTLLDSGDAGVNEVIANDRAFAARLADGSVISWGDAAAGGDSSAVVDQLQADVDLPIPSMTTCSDSCLIKIGWISMATPWSTPCQTIWCWPLPSISNRLQTP